MVSPTGDWLQRPRSKPRPSSSPRPVMPATSPADSLHSTSSNRGTGPATGASVRLSIHPFDLGTEGAQPLIDALVAPLDLPDVVDRAGTVGREGGEEHGHAGPDVGRLDGAALERTGAGDDGPVRIAEHDAGAHADQLVHEEKPRLEHLLEHQQ